MRNHANQWNIFTLAVNTVPADDGARTSAGTVMTKLSQVH